MPRTLDQILSGVTARGKWEHKLSYNGSWLCVPKEVGCVAEFTNVDRVHGEIDAAFAARACSNFEPLVRALEKWANEPCERFSIINDNRNCDNTGSDPCRSCEARKALEEALK